MPEEYPDKLLGGGGGGARQSVRDSPELASTLEQAHSVPKESPNRERTSFYNRRRRERVSSESDSLRMGSEAESITGDDKEFLFPIEKDLQSSLKLDSAPNSRSTSSFSSSPRVNHRFRAHSVSNPVYKSSYASLPQSPATTFLAQFASPDDSRNFPEVEDGTVIDRYQVGRVIGRGSFSECREATYRPDESSGDERVAMKIVKSNKPESENLLNFDKELSVWKRFRHRNILPLLDCIRGDGMRIAISPVADNGTLLSYISTNGPFTEAQARIIFRQIVNAVSHMHNDHDIVHRDLKLDNILLDDQLAPYICDFGLSESTRLEDHEGGSRGKRSEGEIFCKGSLWYIPPEELEPNLRNAAPDLTPAEYRKKGDIWSLGVVLYGMVAGRLPFTDDFLPRLQATVTSGAYPPLSNSCSDGLKDLVAKLLTVRIHDRPCIDMVTKHDWLRT